jgi:hypothetical protein
MDRKRLAEIEERLSATTPGPWRHGSLWSEMERVEPVTTVIASEPTERDGLLLTHTFSVTQPWQHVTANGEANRHEFTDWLCRCEADARFFAHARQDIEDLLAEVKRLREGRRDG